MFSEDRLDRAHDSVPPADFDAISHLKGLLVVQTAGRHNLFAAPKFVPIVDTSHRGQGRYAPRASCPGLLDRGSDASSRSLDGAPGV